MPTYNITGTPYSTSDAINVLVDGGEPPHDMYLAALAESQHLQAEAYFLPEPTQPVDGSSNLTQTTTDWHNLMVWATRPLVTADQLFGTAEVVDYVMRVFQEGVNVSAIAPPYVRSPGGVWAVDAQPSTVTWMVAILRSVYLALSLGNPTQVV